MKKLKTYATYEAAIQAERDREKQWRKTAQGAFESSMASFEESKEAFYPLAAVSAPVRRAVVQDPVKARRAYSKAYKQVMRNAPHCLEVFKLILRNGTNRRKSICEMTNTIIEKKHLLNKESHAKKSTRHRNASTSSKGAC